MEPPAHSRLRPENIHPYISLYTSPGRGRKEVRIIILEESTWGGFKPEALDRKSTFHIHHTPIHPYHQPPHPAVPLPKGCVQFVYYFTSTSGMIALYPLLIPPTLPLREITREGSMIMSRSWITSTSDSFLGC